MSAQSEADEPVVDVGDTERRFFGANGYLAFDRITTEAELERLRAFYQSMLETPRSGFLDGVFDLSRPYGTTDTPSLGQLLRPERHFDAIENTSVWRNARRICAGLLGLDEDELEFWSHLIFKAPFSDAETPWHQDEAYWDVHLQYRSVATWLPLDDVSPDNGCLWYVPGSHKGEVLRHRHFGGDANVHVLEIDEPADTSAAVPVPMSAGGLVVHDPRVLHHSGPNHTGEIRRAWGLVFQSAPIRRERPADHPWWHEGQRAHAEGFARRGPNRND